MLEPRYEKKKLYLLVIPPQCSFRFVIIHFLFAQGSFSSKEYVFFSFIYSCDYYILDSLSLHKFKRTPLSLRLVVIIVSSIP